MPIDKKQWFPALDSAVKKSSGNGYYYNVEVRFSDHLVLNKVKSELARHNVWDVAIAVHSRFLRSVGDGPAIKNMSTEAIRFDKGGRQSQEDFEAAKKAIVRCPAAWEHYQHFREAPVTASEAMAMEQIAKLPRSAAAPADEDDDEDEVAHVVPVAAPNPAKAKVKAKAAA